MPSDDGHARDSGSSDDDDGLPIVVESPDRSRGQALAKLVGKEHDLHPIMLAAARDGDVKTLRRLLKDGIDGKPCLPDASNVIGQRPLHFASMWGHPDAVSALLDAGADVNIENDDGLTPLFFAVRKGHTQVVQVLLDRGAKIRQLRALLVAAEKAPNGEKLQLQLQMHAKPGNEVTQAVKALNLDKLKSLLDAGKLAEADAWEDSRDRTPLHYAVLASVAIIDQRVEWDEDDIFGANDGLTALEMLVEATKACGEDSVRDACNILDDKGNSPLHYLARAGYAGHPAAMGLLLRAGADPNVQSTPSDCEYTSGQWGKAIGDGEKEIIAIESRPDRTPLHMALESDDPSTTMVKLLLEHRADPNVRDNEQRTALHLALDFEGDRSGIDLAMCELLLQNGADHSLGSNEVGMANTCLHAAATANETDVVKLLLRHGAPHSAPGKGGWTPLTIAARSGGVGIVEVLLAAGADPNTLAPSGKSALELATINNKINVIEALSRMTRTIVT